jgi:mRNA-degrading endonuclease toxin of MazEF toxin-antitoxin module
MTRIRRGQVYFAELGPPGGTCEIAKRRPVVVVSVDAIDRLTDGDKPFVVLVVPGTTGSSATRDFPTNVRIPAGRSGLPEDTVFLAHQARAVDARRLDPDPAGGLSSDDMDRIEKALRYSMGL